MKIETTVYGETVELDPVGFEGDTRMVVTEMNGADDLIEAAIWLNSQQRHELAHALLAVDQ